ncbi:MAG TPA: MmgE/PrpD family protein [Acidimicrobiia bacterium]|nr:MmgE/PrpD family protein [Acidimicrobiia bacterium]
MSERSLTPELCAFLASTDVDDLPDFIIDRTRYLLLDGIACGLVGAHLPWARRAVEGTLPVDNGSGATLWGWDRQVSPLAAALLNGTFVQGFELDDFHPHGALHSSSVVVTAALAAAEAAGGMDFRSFLGALALGYEVGPRVGIAMGGAKVTVRGWHTGAVFGPFAAAAAAGKVYGLDAAGFESALGNAGTRAGALMSAQYKSMVKRMHHGMAAQSGLHGAALAAAGFVGIERVIEHEYGGLASTLLGEGGSDDLDRLSRALGEEWTMLDIGIKRHACLIMLHSSIDALVEYRQRPDFDLARIDRIVIDVSESVYKRAAWLLEPPGTSLGSQMNLRYAAAVALLDGAAYVEQFTPESLARPEVWDLMSRTDVRHSDEIDTLGRDRRFVTHIDVRLDDGSSVRLVGPPPQDREFAGADVVSKFRGLLEKLMDGDRIRRIEELVLTGGAATDIRELAGLLAGSVDPALPEEGLS